MLRELEVRLGYGVGTGLNSVSNVREEAIWANDVGFDSFWVSQVFGVDPIVALAAIGMNCPRILEFGTSVVPLTGRHPLALAAQARTAQSALEGRFTLGVGASHQLVSEGFFGEPYGSAFSRTAEFLDALLPLLEGKSADLDGDHVFAKGWLTIECEPVPLLLAALGPKMLALAGERTSGTSLGSCGPRTIASHIVPEVTAAAARAGREKPRVVALVGVCLTNDVDGLRAHSRVQSAMYDTFASYRSVLDREGVASGADLLVAGTPDDIINGLSAYVDAGATDLRIMIAHRTPEEREATRTFLSSALCK